jgi:hypothetical protein
MLSFKFEGVKDYDETSQKFTAWVTKHGIDMDREELDTACVDSQHIFLVQKPESDEFFLMMPKLGFVAEGSGIDGELSFEVINEALSSLQRLSS